LTRQRDERILNSTALTVANSRKRIFALGIKPDFAGIISLHGG
jgi:site-specific DNA-cytosine methylase